MARWRRIVVLAGLLAATAAPLTASGVTGFFGLFADDSDRLFLGEIDVRTGLVTFFPGGEGAQSDGTQPLGPNPFVWNPIAERFHAAVFDSRGSGAASIVSFEGVDGTISGVQAISLPPELQVSDPDTAAMPLRMVFDPVTGVIYAIVGDATTGNRHLCTLDPGTGALALVGSGWGRDTAQAAFVPGNAAIDADPLVRELYFVGFDEVDDEQASLFAVDLSDGTLSDRGLISLPGFGPSDGQTLRQNGPTWLSFDATLGLLYGDAWEYEVDSAVHTRHFISIEPDTADAVFLGEPFSYYLARPGVSGWDPGLRRMYVVVEALRGDAEPSVLGLSPEFLPTPLSESSPLTFDPLPGAGEARPFPYHATFVPEPSALLQGLAALLTIGALRRRALLTPA